MIRTAATLCAVCLISLMLASQIEWTGETYALAMMVVDTLAAVVILIRPAGKFQSIIGLTFLLQITVYFARLLTPLPDWDAYWYGLSILAFLQLFILGGWPIHDMANRRAIVPWFGRVRHPAHRKGVG